MSYFQGIHLPEGKESNIREETLFCDERDEGNEQEDMIGSTWECLLHIGA